jgi:hypothetical protein
MLEVTMANSAVSELRREPLEWIRAHEELSRLAKRRAELEWEEGRALLAALRQGVHRHLGFGSFIEYVEVLFGYKRRSVEEKLRVAEALEVLPVLGNALRQGQLNWSAVRELTRVATSETERAWREVARGKSVRQIEELVAGRKLGDTPDSPADPKLRRHVLTFEVRPETLAMFRDALAKLRRDAGEPLDEETALLLMARQILGGPTDTGRSNYQVALTVCEQCGRGFQQGRGEQLEVESDVTQMACCDAQYIGRFTDAKPGSAHANGEAREAPGTGESAHVGGETRKESSVAGDRGVDVVAGLVAAAQGQRVRPGISRASQGIPPATRRLVLRRDHGQCVVPGCRHAVFVDVHHLQLRSEGGNHDADSLVVLCAAHHRALHRGLLIAEGSSAVTVTFRHADGSAYGDLVSPRSAMAQTQAFAALRKLGFSEGEVRRALARLRTDGGFDHEGVEQIVRAALGVLTRGAVAAAPAARSAG